MDENNDGKLMMEELESAFRSARYDQATVQSINCLQIVIKDPPGTFGIHIGGKVTPSINLVDRSSLFPRKP